MKNFIVTAVLALVLFSCNNSKEPKYKMVIKKNVENDVVADSTQDEIAVAYEDFKSDFKVLIPRSYRTWENKNPVDSLNQNWTDLYEENGSYFLAKANYEIEKGFDECSGDSLKSINPKNKSLIFMDYPELKMGKINAVKITKDKIWPNEKMSLVLNNLKYTFRAEGKVLSSQKIETEDGKEDFFKEVKNYKLYLTVENNPEKLILEQENFHDTFVELLFAGDIDGDGKLDLIFRANRDYEEERVILFLSSKAQNGDAMKKTAEIAVQFDC
ncbi:hypothetical protein [Flavobacterium reichenbachii]|uniref:hypothetical protein n=1 Tax=Flavobacterium reichenbachii TaxID=362418 RepID=UPI00068D4E08|nr:hypothetical protein [Flavobacterium reichenbachii]OXB13637.1 hypothetical protein B0A68_14905 [Flavobacterium reichenbachii]